MFGKCDSKVIPLSLEGNFCMFQHIHRQNLTFAFQDKIIRVQGCIKLLVFRILCQLMSPMASGVTFQQLMEICPVVDNCESCMYLIYFDIYLIAFRYCIFILYSDFCIYCMYFDAPSCMCSEGITLFLRSSHNNKATVTTNELQTKTKSYLVSQSTL